MNKEINTFMYGLSVGAASMLIVFMLIANNLGFKDDEVVTALRTCIIVQAELDTIYYDGDFECKNGAFFSR